MHPVNPSAPNVTERSQICKIVSAFVDRRTIYAKLKPSNHEKEITVKRNRWILFLVLGVLALGLAVLLLVTILHKPDAANDEPQATAVPDVIETTLPDFPGVTFRQSSGAVEAIENGRARTLFQGMPVVNLFFEDVTGDGKPDLCATVCFGSGIVDTHIVVYDYANAQSCVLSGRMEFDYHFYRADGLLLVGKMPYMGDKQVDFGTLEPHDGILCYHSHADGSYLPLAYEVRASDLYGEWLVKEETDNDGNVLYTASVELWKEYDFKNDGTVTYNETVPVSSDSELAFGHPKSYPYEVHDGCVYIDGDSTDGFFRWGWYDRDADTVTLMYNTAEQTVYATLRRMGSN